MGDVVVGNGEIDCWREVVPVQHEDRQLTVQVLFRILKYSTAAKEFHIKLTSEEDDCFLYRAIITPEEHRRLMLSHSMTITFDQLPEYFRQLLRSVKHEGEHGERYFINVLAQNTPGLAARIELLITMRQSGYVVQNKRLCLPFTLASDSDFKEHLLGCFDKIKKEKEQLRRSVTLLETQLREERVRSQELEDKNRWLQKELEFSQSLLRSAENIQKHYESLLNQKHRGEIGGSVLVKIEDSAMSGDNALAATGLVTTHSKLSSSSSIRSLVGERASIIQSRSMDDDSSCADMDDYHAGRRSPLISVDDDNNAAMSALVGGIGSTKISISTTSPERKKGISPTRSISIAGIPVITAINSLIASTTSPVDKKLLKGAAKRKASFHNFTTGQSQSGSNGPIAASLAATICSTMTSSISTFSGGDHADNNHHSHRPPPRKFAAAMVQMDSQLIQIRREQEQQQKKVEDEEEEEEEEEVKMKLSSAGSSIADMAAAATSPPPQLAVRRKRESEMDVEDIPAPKRSVGPKKSVGRLERTPPPAPVPQRPFSQPPALVPPQAVNTLQQHQLQQPPHQSAFVPPQPPLSLPPVSLVQNAVPASIPGQFPPHLQNSWHHIVSNPSSLPLVSGFPMQMATPFHGHRDFMGMNPYLLSNINSVTGGVVTPMATSAMPAAVSSSSFNTPGGPFEDSYNHMSDVSRFARNITESTEVLNDRIPGEMSGDAWPLIPKTEPLSDYQDDQLSDTCSRDSTAAPGLRNGTVPGSSVMMGHRPVHMPTTAMNENSMGGGNESPPPNGAVTGSYSTSASPSLSTSSADGVDGVISYLKCLICERSLSQEVAAAHMAQHITDPQRCTICTEMPPFPSKDELVKHMVGHCARAYACRFCGKENPRVHYLKIHVRSHTGEKPYTCLQCGRGFADASTWRRHERVHTGEKPYECTICGRRIARRDNVKIHMRSHMRSKVQMSCRTCGKVFAQPNHLVLHERMCGSGSDMKGASSSSAADISI